VRLWHILVVPKFGVSTPLIFRKWDELPVRARLTTPKSGDRLLALALARQDRGLISRCLFNGLEEATFASYPRVRAIKQRLAGLGVKLILMSGSGPAVFGILSSRKEAVSLGKQLKRGEGWRVFITRTI
jgi:4-diphosphocytidyl-2-C-methyl-D-erythritol kinase